MHADVMEKALEIHDQIMRKNLEEFGGYEVKTEGDAFFVSFERAVDAVQFGIAVQRQLLNVDWPEALFKHPDSAIETSPSGKIIYKVSVWSVWLMGCHLYCSFGCFNFLTDYNDSRASVLGWGFILVNQHAIKIPSQVCVSSILRPTLLLVAFLSQPTFRKNGLLWSRHQPLS